MLCHPRASLSTFTFASLSALLVAAACSPGAGDGGNGDGSLNGDGDVSTGDGDSSSGDGDDGGDGDIVIEGDGDGDVGSVAPGSCGEQERTATQLPPDLLILLDRSGSMVENTIEGGSNTRWVEATQALSAALMSTEHGINWGLKLYPDDDWCGVSTGANVDVAPMNAQPIIDVFTAKPPVSGLTHTPTRSAVEQGQAYIQTLTTANPKAIVLVTDGEPNCRAPYDADGVNNDADGERDVEPPIAAVANAYAAGIPVYVVGFSISKDNTTAALNSIAEAGGKSTGNPFAKYYTAEDAAQFQAAMEEISADAATCTFELEEAPPQGVTVSVYLESADNTSFETIERDDSKVDGWAFTDESTIEIYGASCDRVLSATSETLKAGFDCIAR